MTIWEIERKYKIPNEQSAIELLQRLRKAGFSEERRQLQRDEYYDTDESELERLDYTVRLRIIDGISMIALKGPRRIDNETYSRVELEFSGASPLQNRLELAQRGLEPQIIIEKRRTLFTGPQIAVAVDQVAQLGWFCEVEGKSAETISELAVELGIQDFKIMTQNYTELLQQKCSLYKRAFEAVFSK